jgi:hypothetical protein
MTDPLAEVRAAKQAAARQVQEAKAEAARARTEPAVPTWEELLAEIRPGAQALAAAAQAKACPFNNLKDVELRRPKSVQRRYTTGWGPFRRERVESVQTGELVESYAYSVLLHVGLCLEFNADSATVIGQGWTKRLVSSHGGHYDQYEREWIRNATSLEAVYRAIQPTEALSVSARYGDQPKPITEPPAARVDRVRQLVYRKLGDFAFHRQLDV